MVIMEKIIGAARAMGGQNKAKDLFTHQQIRSQQNQLNKNLCQVLTEARFALGSSYKTVRNRKFGLY